MAALDKFREECKSAWESFGLDTKSIYEEVSSDPEKAIDFNVPEGRQELIRFALRQIKPEDQIDLFCEISYYLKRAARQLSPDQLRIAIKLIQLLHSDGFRIERVIPLLAAVLFGEEDELIWVNAQNALNTLTPKAPSPSPESSKSEGFVEAAFWKKDRSQNHVASHFVHERLCTYYQDYRKSSDTYVAPYTTIVGPSGIGKSFVVKQLSVSHHQYIIYINLSARTSGGYPKRSPVADIIDTFPKGGVDTCTAPWKMFIVAAYWDTIICYNAGISPEDHFKLQVSNDRYRDQLRLDVRRYLETLQDDESEVNVATKDFITKRKERVKGTKSLPGGTSMGNESGPTIVVCLDEARSLLDDEKRDASSCLFRAFRRAINELFEEELPNDLARDFYPFQSAVGTALTPNYSMFCVLLDTTSKVTNFAPIAKFDPSQKVLPRPVNLFEPIYSIETHDAFADNGFTGIDGTTDSMKGLFKLGRPMWGAFLNEGYSVPELIILARSKLGPQDDPNRNLVLMSQRIQFYISQYELAEHMVANCMRYIFFIDPTRTQLSTTVFSEPILALAASRHMRTPSEKLECVRAVLPAFFRGSIDIGDSGEMVAAMILLMTMDSTINTLKPSTVTVGQFLHALLGKKPAEQMKSQADEYDRLAEIWDKGTVYFNHFFRPLTEVTRSVTNKYPSSFTKEAYRRAAALFFPENFPGVDIGIPVKLGDGDYTLILIQVKNWANGSLIDSMKTEAESSAYTGAEYLDDFNPCFGLMMSLFEKDSRSKGFAVCGGLKRANKRQKTKSKYKSDDASKMVVGLSVGVDSSLYPSVCGGGSGSASDKERDF